MKLKKPNRAHWLLLGAALFATVSGITVNQYWTRATAQQSAGAKLLALRLLDTADHQTALAHWRGKPMLINFWGTWCPPCREEMPLLNAAAQKYGPRGVQFVGVSIDDEQAVRDYASHHPTSYPLLLGSFDLLGLTSELGNRAQVLPFSVILQANGAIKKIKLGPFRGEELSQELDSLVGPR